MLELLIDTGVNNIVQFSCGTEILTDDKVDKTVVIDRLSGVPIAVFESSNEDARNQHTIKTTAFVDIGKSKFHGFNILASEQGGFFMTALYCTNGTKFLVNHRNSCYDFETQHVSTNAIESTVSLYASNLMRGRERYEDFNNSHFSSLFKSAFAAVVKGRYEIMEFFLPRDNDLTAISGRIYYDKEDETKSILSLGGQCHDFCPDVFPLRAVGASISGFKARVKKEEEKLKRSGSLVVKGNNMTELLRQLEVRPQVKSALTTRRT